MPKKKNKTGCKDCHNQGYTVDKNGQYAFAKVCSCVLNCEECKGEGYIIEQKDNGYSYMLNCSSCESIRLRVKRYNQAQIPSKY
ncbi:MAG: hypothetical protein ACRENO_02115, partial [Thermodesulfobacteriota bacterium]